MQIQLYLSAEVQSHFGISPQEIKSDLQTPLHADWKALWYCEHLISTDDGLEHLYIFSNALTHYALIMVDRDRDFQSLLGSFQQHFALALHEHGQAFATQAIEAEVELLNGQAPSRRLQFQTDHAIELLLANDSDIDAAEEFLNQFENFHFPKSPSDAMRERLSPTHTQAEATILPFQHKRAK
ncbi:hypothetical protein ACFSW8_11380 [Rubritalea tangerina]|uniref:Uncharacterized protein n=2 Tax=Rubritalea tangerina TaxID=430798 RepID=A0ABW4ZC90_9BACT